MASLKEKPALNWQPGDAKLNVLLRSSRIVPTLSQISQHETLFFELRFCFFLATFLGNTQEDQVVIVRILA